MQIHIKNPAYLEKITSQIKEDGLDSLHILSDFDRTLTYGTYKGVKTPSMIALLRDGNHLTEDYAEKAHTLFNHYHPIEIDPHFPFAEKKKLMDEWWLAHNTLLIESGLAKSDIEDIITLRKVAFREGVAETLDFLWEHKIPLVILSAGVCGDAIRLLFQSIGKNFANIHYVANNFYWGDDGKAISTKGKVITCFNKDETILQEIPEVYGAIKERKNVILLGDGLGDLGMIEGFEYDNLLKIGFLNYDYDTSKEAFEEHFDVVIEGDGDFNFVRDLVKGLGG